MSNVRNFSLLLALALNGLHVSSHADSPSRFDDEKIIQTLKDNYRIYAETNAKKLAQREMAEFVFHSTGATTDLLSNLQKVSLPICDLDRPAFEWRFVAPSDAERVLKYVGDRNLGTQFLRWTDSVWIRLGGPDERYREGMYCGRPFSEGPQIENYVAIDVDANFADSAKNRKFSSDTTQNALFQLGSKVQANVARKMEGELQISASSGLRDVKVTVELWSVGANGSVMVSKVSKPLSNDPLKPHTIHIEGQVEARRQSFMVAKVDSNVIESAARGDIAGRIFLFNARLQPVE